jgi:hypothetical protein
MFGEFVYEFTFTPGVNTSAKLTITSDEIFPNFDSGGVVIDEIVIETTAGGGDDVTGSIVPFYRGVNTAVMVYDHLNNAWAGIDRVIDADGNDALLVQDFFKHRFMGEERLFAILADGRVVIVEYGFYDDVIDTAATFQRVEIQPMFKSRGYDFQFASEKQYISCLAAFKTWNPKVTFKSYVDGVRESKILMADMTRDRTKFWRPAWKAPWSEDNSGDDFFDPDREDYSVFLGPLDEIDLGANGIDPDLLQDSQEGFRVNERGRYVQIEIIGSQGRCALEALSVNAAPGEQQLNRQQ